MKKILLFSVVILLYGNLFSQSSAAVKGVVLDDSYQPLPYVNVYVDVAGEKQGATTDFDGVFTIKPLRPGTYNLTVSCVGYQEQIIKSVIVKPNEITSMKNIVLKAGIDLPIVDVIYTPKVIRIDDPDRVTIDPVMLENMPNKKDLSNVVRSTSSEVNVSDDGKELYFKGSRNGASGFYIDGVKVSSLDNSLPSSIVGSFMMYSGGIPAEYGDVTGGVVVVESKSFFDIAIERENRKK